MFKNLFKKQKKVEQTSGDDLLLSSIDRLDAYYERAFDTFCTTKELTSGAVTESINHEIQMNAGNHIGMFITWLALNDGLIAMDTTHIDAVNAIHRVKEGKLTGTEYLINFCDGKFWIQDVAVKYRKFVSSYYPHYFSEYCSFVIDEIYDLPLEFISSDDDTKMIVEMISEAYLSWSEANILL